MGISMQMLIEQLRAVGNTEYVCELEGGFRNQVLLLRFGAELVVAKSTRRSEAQLRWLLPVQAIARDAGFIVPEFLQLNDRLLISGWTLEQFIGGTPLKESELADLKPGLECFHCLAEATAQRPGFASSGELLHVTAGGDVDLQQMPARLQTVCRRIWARFQMGKQTVIHGDLNTANILRTAEGQLALLDWDESRVDLAAFDLLNIPVRNTLSPSQKLLLDAWEVAVCWQVEPEYARRLAERLLTDSAGLF